ncbi:MAG: CoA activase, partial [Atopobiaceae bacterium]
LADKAKEVLSLCNTMGEGWLLTAEMCDLIESGTPNIIVCSPFACLPNHVVGKSVIKRLRQMHPESNIVAVDYDPGASEVNQLNRIKLMISVAKENFKNGRSESFHLENPDDPVTNESMLPRAVYHRRRPGELEDSFVREGSKATGAYASYGETTDADGGKTYGTGEGAIHLTPEQLKEIDEAKRKAGVL